jgi:hypothetical protein
VCVKTRTNTGNPANFNEGQEENHCDGFLSPPIHLPLQDQKKSLDSSFLRKDCITGSIQLKQLAAEQLIGRKFASEH